MREGGKHAIYRYHPKTEINEKFVGRLLRIDKDNLAKASSISVLNVNSYDDSKQIHSSVVSASFDFGVMIAEKLTPYVDVPVLVSLDWEFLKALRKQTFLDNKISTLREQDWQHRTSVEKNKMNEKDSIPVGMIIKDYRFSPLSYDLIHNNQQHNKFSHQDNSCISIEIKPKAGYLTFSPLVNESRINKYFISRYLLQQQLYRNGSIQKEWMHQSPNATAMSLYDPIDLFSNNEVKIRKAIKCLFECPQNNMKIWKGDDVMFGADLVLKYHDLAEFFQIDSDTSSENEVTSYLIEIITAVFMRESLLNKLLVLQRLDVLDADGAAIIYEHLVHLCNGEHDIAENIVDTVNMVKDKKAIHIHQLLDASAFQPPNDISRLRNLCAEIEAFKILIEKSSPSSPPLEHIRKAKSITTEVIKGFDISECTFLLQSWLLSLAMCDVSIFLSIEYYDPIKHVILNSDISQSLQTMLKPGILNTKGKRFLYSIKVIDFDRKPSKKLRTRLKKEIAFNNCEKTS